LIRRPGFTVIAALTLALGVGANTSIFSVVSAVVFRPLPFHEPDRLVRVFETYERDGFELRSVGYPTFLDWREQNGVFDIVGVRALTSVTLTGTDEPLRLNATFVSPSYFSLVSVRPVVGRTFDVGDNGFGQAVAVISHGLWQRRFGGDPAAVGSTVQLNGVSTEIVGVMTVSFGGMQGTVDIWLPMLAAAEVLPVATVRDFELRGRRWLGVFARLKPGVSVAEAQADLDVITSRLRGAYPDSYEDRAAFVVSLEEQILGEAQHAAMFLFGAVGILVVIACANVTGLLLTRDLGRTREIALRQALGAGRLRLARYLFTESVGLGVLGGGLGLALAFWLTDALTSLNPISLPSYIEIGVDPLVLGFTLAFSVLTGLVVGVLPALNGTRVPLGESLKGASRTVMEGFGTGRRGNVRNLLVVGQVGLALVLLMGAGLMTRSLGNQLAIDAGIDGDDLLTLRVQLPSASYELADVPVFARRLLERIEASPGVERVAVSTDLPLTGSSSAIIATPHGATATASDSRVRVYWHRVTPAFFQTMGMTLLRGRDFTSRDAEGSPGVVIVSEAFARRAWPGEDPIGRSVTLRGIPRSVVGVAGDARYRSLVSDPLNNPEDPDVYVPLSQNPWRSLSLAVRTTVQPAVMVGTIRRQLSTLDPSLPVFQVVPMSELLAQQVSLSRFVQQQLGIFSVLALGLATVGLYGVLSHLVAQRTSEIGVRMALGAGTAEVVKLVLRQGLALAVGGVAVGLAVALATTRVMTGLVYGVSPTDPATFLTIVAVLMVAATLACCVPAHRAARVDPLKALRFE
jgi:putative ABC transport system permease protein